MKITTLLLALASVSLLRTVDSLNANYVSHWDEETLERSSSSLARVRKECPDWPNSVFNGSLPQHAKLPDLLTFNDGSKVATPELWFNRRRQEIRIHLERYIFGSPPATTPKLKNAQVLDGSDKSSDGISRMYSVNVTFEDQNPDRHTSFVMQVLLPKAHTPKVSKAKIFMTQRNHFQWGRAAALRGYVSCIYPGSDTDDQTHGFRTMYPNANWALLLRRAWLGMRALDYCLTLVQTDANQVVAVTGHSRNGKQSLLFGAFDERVTMVVPSSSGIGGWATLREASIQAFAESPADAPSDWYVPSYPCFLGLEDRLPMDLHGLVSLIAPRPVLATTARNDACESVYTTESTYRAVLPVYQFLGAGNNIRIQYRPAQHHGYTSPDDYIDFMDAFSSTCDERLCNHVPDEFALPQALYMTFNWHTWREVVGDIDQDADLASSGLVALGNLQYDGVVDSGVNGQDLANRLQTKPPANRLQTKQQRLLPSKSVSEWFLGESPSPDVRTTTWMSHGEESQGLEPNQQAYITLMATRDQMGTKDVVRADVSFGEYHTASIYYSKSASKKGALPVVLWLHPFSYNTGFNEDYYTKESDRISVYHRIAAQGFAVIAWDMAGFGMRQGEVYGQFPSKSRNGTITPDQWPFPLPRFYWRFPRWSLFGKHVHDARTVIDFIHNPNNPKNEYSPLGHGGYKSVGVPAMNSSQVFALGFSQLGGNVAMFLGATDNRLRGVVSIAGLTSFRRPVPELGNRLFFENHALLPKLGYFHNQELHIPFDMDDVLAEIQCPVFVYAAKFDRFNPVQHVRQIVKQARNKGANVDLQVANNVGVLDISAVESSLTWIFARMVQTQN